MLPLVRLLLTQALEALALVAVAGSTIAGNVIFTLCGVAGCPTRAALLGPLAVAPNWQRRGIGRSLVREGLNEVGTGGATHVCVLGDPAYYGLLGFRREVDIEPPYRLPDEWQDAWQSIELLGNKSGETKEPCRGKLVVPQPWQQPALWAP